MAPVTTRSQLLDEIETERKRLEANLAGLSEAEMLEPGACGDWSVKDILAHLVAWEQLFLGSYAAGLREETPKTPAPDLNWRQLDVLNRRIYEQHRNQSLDDVRAAFAASYRDLMATVQAIPEEDLFAPSRFAWTGHWTLVAFVRGNSSSHYLWAKTLIRKWRKARESALPKEEQP
ncbi:MAG TPA: ClbS/DfsB family four-helix bundle protein [Aggregatilineaceae bacterium]|nr:ClbS/DfsB family four-helix bundle protein [Aggregatilineaceae bacterium]